MDKHIILYTCIAHLLAYCLCHCIVHLHAQSSACCHQPHPTSWCDGVIHLYKWCHRITAISNMLISVPVSCWGPWHISPLLDSSCTYLKFWRTLRVQKLCLGNLENESYWDTFRLRRHTLGFLLQVCVILPSYVFLLMYPEPFVILVSYAILCKVFSVILVSHTILCKVFSVILVSLTILR